MADYSKQAHPVYIARDHLLMEKDYKVCPHGVDLYPGEERGITLIYDGTAKGVCGCCCRVGSGYKNNRCGECSNG